MFQFFQKLISSFCCSQRAKFTPPSVDELCTIPVLSSRPKVIHPAVFERAKQLIADRCSHVVKCSAAEGFVKRSVAPSICSALKTRAQRLVQNKIYEYIFVSTHTHIHELYWFPIPLSAESRRFHMDTYAFSQTHKHRHTCTFTTWVSVEHVL